VKLTPAQARRRDRKIARRRHARTLRIFASQVAALMPEEPEWVGADPAAPEDAPPAGRAVFVDAAGEGLDILLDWATDPEVYRPPIPSPEEPRPPRAKPHYPRVPLMLALLLAAASGSGGPGGER